MSEVPSISAVVFLKSRSGESLSRERGPVTSGNIDKYRPTPETVAKAVHGLEQLGFTVAEKDADPGDILTLTLTGSVLQFEKVFGVKITVERRAPTFESLGGVIPRADKDLVIPESLRDVVEKVGFEEPIELFDQ